MKSKRQTRDELFQKIVDRLRGTEVSIDDPAAMNFLDPYTDGVTVIDRAVIGADGQRLANLSREMERS